MEHELFIALIAGLGAMLGWGTADFLAKKTIDVIGDITTLFWGQVFGIFPLLLLFIVQPIVPIKIDGYGFSYLIFLGIWSGLSYIPTYVAFGKGKVSLLSPIFATYAVIVTILSAVFLHERILFSRGVSIAIVFTGVLIINGDLYGLWSLVARGKKIQHEPIKGLKEILSAVCVYSIWLIALNDFIKDEYWVPFLLLIRIFSALALYVYAKGRRIKLRVRARAIWITLLFIGLFDVSAFAFVSYGFSKSSYVSVVATLSSVFSLPTILFARIFLKEETTRSQQAGIVVVILGIIVLTLW